MMRRLYLSATVVFWLLVAAFWIGGKWLPSAGESAAIAAERVIPAAELAKHAMPGNCWMAIRGSVYDLGTYLPQHPSPPEIVTSWCGKEATVAYDTKTKGRPHSPYADELLAKYRIGMLAPAQSR
ncbi:MAG: cytochrome b5 domain-containing protein [Nitrosomonadales bacterium]|nr:cytochrome b5 domain-containing protein [Nitrosomonadales bacterium]